MRQIEMAAARKNAGIRQDQMARELGVSVNKVIDWEKGRKPVDSKERAEQYCKVCGFKLSEVRISYVGAINS